MKKEYKKPEIVFENFSLSTTIASGCKYTPTSPELIMPGPDGDTFVFTTGCGYDVTFGQGGDGFYQRICYQVIYSAEGGGVVVDS